MRNRFNINESEKNRIRGLHGMQVIKEQEKGRKKISQEDYGKIMGTLGNLMMDTFNGDTVNLWTTDNNDDEVSSLGSWTITYMGTYSELDEKAGEDYSSIMIDFKFLRPPTDKSKIDVMKKFMKDYAGGASAAANLSVIWQCGDKSFVTDTAATSSETGPLPGTFTSVSLINKLNSKLCDTIEWKDYDKLFSPNGNYIVTDMDVDLVLGDEDIETLT